MTEWFYPALELATPELYDRNAFRLLELPVTASERDLSRRRELIQRASRANHPIPPGAARLFPRVPPPDEHDVQEAEHAIQDAERRLAHEFFWFWSADVEAREPDPAWRFLIQGSVHQALRVWQEQEHSAANGPVARHNIALLHHFLAIEFEKLLLGTKLGGIGSGWSVLTEDQYATDADRHWHEASKHWAVLADDASLWGHVAARIRAIDDPSLTADAAQRLQHTFAATLTLIDAKLAIRAWDQDKPDQAVRHAERIRTARLPQEGVKEGLRRAVEPLRPHLNALRETALRESKADPVNADKAVERLISEAGTSLGLLDLLLPAEHPTRQAEHDEAAIAAMFCQIKFHNSTHDYRRALVLQDRIDPIAAGAGAKDRLAYNRKIIERNLLGAILPPKVEPKPPRIEPKPPRIEPKPPRIE
ncbi:MAG: hypothetical protein ACREC6_10420, partial [Hyphomicrobiaceae bacterium]